MASGPARRTLFEVGVFPWREVVLSPPPLNEDLVAIVKSLANPCEFLIQLLIRVSQIKYNSSHCQRGALKLKLQPSVSLSILNLRLLGWFMLMVTPILGIAYEREHDCHDHRHDHEQHRHDHHSRQSKGTPPLPPPPRNKALIRPY